MSTDKKFYTRQELEKFTNSELRGLQKKHSIKVTKTSSSKSKDIINRLLKKFTTETDLTNDTEPNLDFKDKPLPASPETRAALVTSVLLDRYSERPYYSNIPGKIGLMTKTKEEIEEKAKELDNIFKKIEKQKGTTGYILN